MKNSLKTTKITYTIFIIIGVLLIGLAAYVAVKGDSFGSVKKKPTSTPAPSPTDIAIKTEGDTTANIIITQIDQAQKQLYAYNPESDTELVLNYTGATQFITRFGQQISAAILEIMSVADISYDKASLKLYKLTLSDEYTSISKPESWSINGHMLTIGSNNYRLGEKAPAFDSGKKTDISKLSPLDTINVICRDSRIYAIEIVAGHGNLQLKNESAYIGGEIFVDNEPAGTISEGLLLPLTEGKHTITFTKDKLSGKEEVEILRDTNTELDLLPYSADPTRYGFVSFEITLQHSDAEVTSDIVSLNIDGYGYDHFSGIRLEYGTHHITISSPGYVSWENNAYEVNEQSSTLFVLLQTENDDGK